MGKASSNKKVARAASTGGGRTARGKRPYGWYSALTVLCVLGVFLVAFSRHQQQAAAAVHPRGADHWHMAYAIDLCGTIEPPLAQNTNLSSSPAPGIHTHGDGLIHEEPYVSGLSVDAGNHATVAQFAADYPGFKLTSSEIQIPGQTLRKNGDKCNGKPAEVRIRFWPKATGSTSVTYFDPKAVHIKDGAAVTIAFLPAGDDIPKPSTTALSNLGHPNTNETTPAQATIPVNSTPTTAATTSASTAPASTPTSTGSPGTTAAGTPPTSR